MSLRGAAGLWTEHGGEILIVLGSICAILVPAALRLFRPFKGFGATRKMLESSSGKHVALAPKATLAIPRSR